MTAEEIKAKIREHRSHAVHETGCPVCTWHRSEIERLAQRLREAREAEATAALAGGRAVVVALDDNE